MLIPGDTAHITRHYAFVSDAQLILVIEKDAIFQVGMPQLQGVPVHTQFTTRNVLRVNGHSCLDLPAAVLRRVPCLDSALYPDPSALPHRPCIACARPQRLAEERFFDHVPCILVTGKGVPDLATRQALG